MVRTPLVVIDMLVSVDLCAAAVPVVFGSRRLTVVAKSVMLVQAVHDNLGHQG